MVKAVTLTLMIIGPYTALKNGSLPSLSILGKHPPPPLQGSLFPYYYSLVQTEMGNRGAKLIGLELAPNSLEESTSKTIAVVSVSLDNKWT